MQGTRRIFFQNARNLANLHRHCELGKKGLKCPRRPSWPSRRPRPSSRPLLMSLACTRHPWLPSRPFFASPRTFLTTHGLFRCPGHVLDVHGSLHGLFWRPMAFLDDQRPFLMFAARTRGPWLPSRPFLTTDGLLWQPTAFLWTPRGPPGRF